MLFYSNYAIVIVIAILHFLLYIAEHTQFWYFETKSLHSYSHQRPSVKLKMHQNKSRLGLCRRPHSGSLQHSSRLPSWIITYRPFKPPLSVITLFGFQMLSCMMI